MKGLGIIVVLWLGFLPFIFTQVPVTHLQYQNEDIPLLCLSCTSVDQGIYRKTDNTGKVILTFNCEDSPITKKFCAQPSLKTIAQIIPNIGDTCLNSQYIKTCWANENVLTTIWGDARLDPGLLTVASPSKNQLEGKYRDLDPEEYDIMAHRVDYTPKHSRGNDMGSPDIYAYTKGSIWHSLAWSPSALLPKRTNINDRTQVTDYESNPPYQNFNKRLLLYSGYDDKKLLDWMVLNKHTPCQLDCFNRRLYEYLTTHGETYFISNKYLGSVSHVAGAHLDLTLASYSLENQIEYGLNCHSNCLTYWGPTSKHRIKMVLTESINKYKDVIHFEYQMGNINAGQDLRLDGRPLGSNSVLLMYMDVVRGANKGRAKFPFGMFPVPTTAKARREGYVSLLEQSVDGVNWHLHPQSLHQSLHQFYHDRDWARIIKGSYEDRKSLCAPDTSSTTHCYLPYGTLGSYRYLRLVNIVALGASVKHTSFSRSGRSCGRIAVQPPAALLMSERLENTRIFVTPSLERNSELMDVMGYAQCKDIPNCIYIAPDYWNKINYPNDGIDGNHGSPMVRKFFKEKVFPQLYNGCQKFAPDPVTEFLEKPIIKPFTCYRQYTTPNKATCFEYKASPYQVNTPIIQTDSLRTKVQYHKSGVLLEVTTTKTISSAPLPIYIVGPFTPSSRKPKAYIYNTPVIGSYSFDGLYVTATEACTGGPARAPMTHSTTCNCLEIPFTGTACLCDNLRQYKLVNTIPEGLTFEYPQFFQPIQLPISFTLTNNRLSYDSAVFTHAHIDCNVFLCSNNAKCFKYLEESAYYEFCHNQKKILSNTMNNLKQANGNVGRSVKNYLTKHGTPSNTPIGSVSKLPSLTTNVQTKTTPMSRELRGYYKSFSDTRISQGFSAQQYQGYNYREPLTGPWQATGMAIFPPLGVGILTEKINTLAMQNQGLITAVDGLASDMNEMKEDMANGLQTLHGIAQTQAHAHNQLVEDMNKFSDIQNGINTQFLVAINSLNSRVNDLEERHEILDLIGARASTLVAQSASISILSADHESRARTFNLRVAACTNPSAGSANLCSESSGTLISSAVRQEGSVTILDTLVLEPTKNKYVYSTSEFCYKGLHYVAYSEYVFILEKDIIQVSPRHIYAPEAISGGNTMVLPICSKPEFVVVDFSPTIAAVPLESTFQITSIANGTSITGGNLIDPNTFTKLPSFNQSFVVITNELANLQTSINNIRNITFKPFDPFVPLVEFGGYGVSSYAGIIIAVIALIVSGCSFFFIMYVYCQFKGLLNVLH